MPRFLFALTTLALLGSAACAPPPQATQALTTVAATAIQETLPLRTAPAAAKTGPLRPRLLGRAVDAELRGPATMNTALDDALFAPTQPPALRSAGLVHLARLHLEAGRPEAALAAARAAHELARQSYGPNHVETLASLTALGSSLIAAGRGSEGEATLAEAAMRSAVVLGTDHPATLEARRRLAIRRAPDVGPWLRSLNRRLNLAS